jgi:hypothetical protein
MSDDPKPDPVEAPEEPVGPVGTPPHFPRVKDNPKEPGAKLSMAIGETLALVQRALPYLRAAAARGEPGAAKLVADAEVHSAAVSRSKTKRQTYNDR